jgi:septum formation protein
MSAKTTPNRLPRLPGRTGERQLVLASTSRYRQDLLARLGLTFITVAPDTVEAALAGEAPASTALRLAEAKARSVATATRTH